MPMKCGAETAGGKIDAVASGMYKLSVNFYERNDRTSWNWPKFLDIVRFSGSVLKTFPFPELVVLCIRCSEFPAAHLQYLSAPARGHEQTNRSSDEPSGRIRHQPS